MERVHADSCERPRLPQPPPLAVRDTGPSISGTVIQCGGPGLQGIEHDRVPTLLNILKRISNFFD